MILSAHITKRELEFLLRRDAKAGEPRLTRRVARHILTGCQPCQDKLRIWGQGVFDGCCELSDSSAEEDQEELRPPVAQGGEHDYDRAFAKAEHVLSLFLADGRPREEPPGAILAELFPSAMGEAPPASENRAAIPALIRWLTKRSHKVRYSNPDEMLHWGLMGRLAADSCSAEVAGNRYRLADLRAWAWGQFGNSLRVCGRISESEEAFEAAQRYTASGTGDPVLRARLNEQITALCIFQRRFEDALELDAGAAVIYRDLGDGHRFARVSVQEAIILTYSGESDRAAAVLKRAIPLIKSDLDPHLAAAARHNLVHCYIDAKRPDLAKLAYFQTRELREGLDDGLILLRTRWQEGRLLRSLGHLEAAERALLSAQEGFMEQGLSFEVAVVSHDLAGVLRQMGETKRLEQITLEISTRIQALHTSREALASLQDLRTSLRLSSPSVPASR